MTREKAQALQENITKEAIALLVVTEYQAETEGYAAVVRLIGEAWGIPAEETQTCLKQIYTEAERPHVPAETQTEAAYPEDQLPINATGLETLENLWGLFETATVVKRPEERAVLYALARELADCQNLTDWLDRSAA